MTKKSEGNIKKHLEKFTELPTPFYFYDLDLLNQTIDEALKHAGSFHIHYALKANANEILLKEIAARGLGADCVSGGEIKRAVECSFDSGKIVFAGVAKTDEEIYTGLKHGIFSFNVESLPELEVIGQIAEKENREVSVCFRLNPNVDAHTHKYITTGLEENKFGLHPKELFDALEIVKKYKSLKAEGLHFHIGSQITTLQPFRNLCLKIRELNVMLHERKIHLKYINAGGGLGVDYYHPDENPIPDFKSFFDVFRKELPLLPHQQLHFELGRSIIAQCGSLISRVIFVKHGIDKKFLMIDAGMSELIRPALYQAYHKIQNLSSDKDNPTELYDVVGPICESSDCFGKSVELPKSERGHIIAIRTAGAYGESMASEYNLRKLNRALFFKEKEGYF
ncbi:MAG: diaminopimelate decarboxylase [Bacteroidia bacterium]|nr:diaminopimelate decarboxylase [Bacteroidia bacterium]